MAEKRQRGFAVMDPELVRELARQGGIAAHAQGRAHEFTPAEASAAGRLGGRARQRKFREEREKQEQQERELEKKQKRKEE